jgi:4-alpha-glucanotransferase
MGHFVPSIPLLPEEFESAGIKIDQYRYCKPYITDAVLWEHFGSEERKFKPFLAELQNGFYELKPAFDTQKKVEAYFEKKEKDEESIRIRNGLFDLISNVILFSEFLDGKQVFHFRFHMEKTSSFRHLEADLKQKLIPLYIDYFFQRQDDFWRKEAMDKLPALKKASEMLICGEDLGLVPACVPEVMHQLGFLSLEIQRMPKRYGYAFARVQDAPYLSVVTPSTHDMSTIRGWWQEERNRTQLFFQQEMGQYGEAPFQCEAWVNKTIVWQHMYAPAMWSVFQIQDLLGMDEHLRRPDPEEERINIPSNSKHYWQYRIHLCMEKLINNQSFNSMLSNMIRTSGRA